MPSTSGRRWRRRVSRSSGLTRRPAPAISGPTFLVCLWNGGGGDGPGGTAHMYNEVKRRTGRVTWLDTRTLW
jgi:hypothetical protein